MTATDGWRERLGAARLRAITPSSSSDRRAWPYYSAAIWSLVTVEAPSCPGLGVDERWRLFVRPEHVLSTPVPALADQLVHLVTHLLRLHADRARALGVQSALDERRWLVASDIESNDDLQRDGHETLWPVPASVGLPDGEIAEWYYRLLRPPAPDANGPSGADAADDGQPERQVMLPVVDHDCGSGAGGSRRPWEADAPEGLSEADSDRVRRAVAEAVADHARAAPGTLPAGLVRWAEGLMRPKVDWRHTLGSVIRAAVRNQAGLVDYSYQRPSRRLAALPRVVLPSMVRPAPSIAVVMDTSASVRPVDLGQCLGEVRGILASAGCHRSCVRIICCDSIAYGVREVGAVAGLELVGGGGTDMGAGLAAAADLRPPPEVVIVLTDGFTPWPATRPPMAVVVALLSRGGRIPPPPPWAAKAVEVPVDEVSTR